jgi:hypothetical protein
MSYNNYRSDNVQFLVMSAGIYDVWYPSRLTSSCIMGITLQCSDHILSIFSTHSNDVICNQIFCRIHALTTLTRLSRRMILSKLNYIDIT